MKLLSVEMQGFKSIASRTRLEFSDGITAVIGPNGSGKSNVAEAIRWVLGEQSMKELRGRKSEDIIFSGSEARQASRSAFVELTLENADARFPLEAAEIAIRRTINRDGEGTYSLNGDPVRLLDLQRMLAQAGLGTKSYTVISQGTVDRYLTATPQNRKELFDEATGIKALQLRLAEASRKLTKTAQHQQEVEAVMRELEPRVTVLSRQVKKYEEHAVLTKKFEEAKHTWFFHEWHRHTQHLRGEEEKLAETRARASVAQEQREKAEAFAFASSANDYYRVEQQRKDLIISLEKLANQKAIAEQKLAQARKKDVRPSWTEKAHHVLLRTKDMLHELIKDKNAVSQSSMQTLLHDTDTVLKETDRQANTIASYELPQQLENLLQEVARLSAIEKERKEQLDALPRLTPPSDTTTNPPALNIARDEELAATREMSAAEAAVTHTRAELQHLESEILREMGSAFLSSLEKTSPQENTTRVTEEQLRTMGARLASLGEPDPLVQKEYQEALERYEYVQHQLADISASQQNILTLIAKLEQTINATFMKQFAVIQSAFSHHFSRLFGGGTASLAAGEDGIDISVRPPGKKPRHITLLSGGERALTSIALLLAIIEAQEPPFIVLDEVDAALDEANSARFADTIREHVANTQCIIITHNRQTMSQADILYGVTMQREGISKVYSVRLADVSPETSIQIPT